MTGYFDASALAMLVLRDAGWRDLGDWMQGRSVETVYSDFGWGELISAIGLRVRIGTMSAANGADLIVEAAAYFGPWEGMSLTTADLADAAELVAKFHLKLRFPDAIHIAIARRMNCILVTADSRQAEAANANGLHVYNPLNKA